MTTVAATWQYTVLATELPSCRKAKLPRQMLPNDRSLGQTEKILCLFRSKSHRTRNVQHRDVLCFSSHKHLELPSLQCLVFFSTSENTASYDPKALFCTRYTPKYIYTLKAVSSLQAFTTKILYPSNACHRSHPSHLGGGGGGSRYTLRWLTYN